MAADTRPACPTGRQPIVKITLTLAAGLDVLDAAQGTQCMRTLHRVRPRHGRKLARARAAAAKASRIAQIMAQSAHSEGVSETRIAEELGVDRMTVRKWLGKR